MKVTVKTLDSGRKELEVSEELTVKNLKDEILKEMGIPLDQQRLIFQGKPLKDEMKLKDCGVSGKVIHLVKRPPPSVARETTEQATAEPTTTASSGTVTTESMQTILLPGGMPSHNTLTQVTQNIVDRIVSTLTSHGADAEVSAETITTDSTGATHRATVSARSENFDSSRSVPPPTTSVSDSAATTAPTQSGNTPASSTALPEASPEKMEVDNEKPTETSTASGSSSLVPAEEEVKDKGSKASAPTGTAAAEGTEEDTSERDARRRRNRGKNHTLYNHARTVKRCLDFANKVLNRYDRGSARVKAKIAAERRGEAGEDVPVESWPEVEPMDVLEGATAGPIDSDSDSEPEIRGKLLVIKKKRRKKEPLDERYAILEDPDMPDLPSRFYSVLLEDLQAVYRRLSPLMDEYQRNASEDRELTETESVLAAQVALTVRDTIYYIGHGNVSLARLHINFLGMPPRSLRLAAPHKTEVRRVMMSMRRCFPSMQQRMHEPSGYIVDISRDGEGSEGGQSGERRTTRAVVNRSRVNVGGGMPGYGGMFGPMLGGILGGRRRVQPETTAQLQSSQPAPVPAPSESTSSTSQAQSSRPSSEAAPVKQSSALKPKSETDKRRKVVLDSEDDVKLKEPTEAALKCEQQYKEGWENLSEEEVKKRQNWVKRIEEQRALCNKVAVDNYKEDAEDQRKGDERWNRHSEEKARERREAEEELMKKLKEEELQRKLKEEERLRKLKEEELQRKLRENEKRKKEGGQKTGEEMESESGGSAQGGASQEGGSEATPSTGAAAQGEGKKDDETPRYLARLLSELITGVADPNGPHKPPGQTSDSGSGAAGASGSAASSEPAAAATGEGEKKEEEEGDPSQRKSFAERYAGPEGTTVTIQAAPTAPFGLPMEGPSLSIRNPGAGAEPEMTINFPVPPAIHLLQTILQRAEQRHRERRANGESSSSSSEEEEEEDDDENRGSLFGPGGLFRRRRAGGDGEGSDGANAEGGDKKKKRSRPRMPRPFVEEDGEVESTSECGSLDSMDTDKEEPPDFNNRAMATGEHMTILEAMREVRGKVGMNPEEDSEDEEERHVNWMEKFLKVISRELKVREVVKILQGDVRCLERTQPNFQEFIKDQLLDGAEPTAERKDQAISRFLEHVQPSLEAIESTLPIRDRDINIVETVCKLLYQILGELYDFAINSCTLREQVNKVFAKRLQKWAKDNTQVFACAMRHCVDGEHLYDELICKLVALMFPPSTPAHILHVCVDSVLKWLSKARDEVELEPLELDRYICWREGTKSKPNCSYTLKKFTKDGIPKHERLEIPYPPTESCPGGDGEEDGEDMVATGEDVPAGVPEEWVPTIDRDSKAHSKREGPQQPYSKAYLSGMPAKKRKLDTSEPCSKSTQDFIYEAMEYALSKSDLNSTSGATDPQTLALVHRNQFIAAGLAANVHAHHRERLEGAGVTREQYPHAMEYYHLDPETHDKRLDQ